MRSGARPAELGRLAYPAAELARARAAWRAMSRRDALAAQPRAILVGLILGCLMGLAGSYGGTGPLDGLLAGITILGGCAAWPWRWQLTPDVTLQAWITWAATWEQVARCLRTGLGPDWTICWDRRISGWSEPVTIVVGPSGVWGMWVAPPGATVDPDGLAQLLAQVVPAVDGVWVRVRLGRGGIGREHWRQAVAEMVCGSLCASPGQCRQLVDSLALATMEDPEVMRYGLSQDRG